MHFSTIATATTIFLAGLAAAAPTPDSKGCSAYPWFIVPYPDSASCGGTPATFQPTSGPIVSDPKATGCRPLWDPNGKPQSFASVSINRSACPEQLWEIRLYTDAGCGTKPTVVQSNSCVNSPGWNAAGRWESFEAVPIKPADGWHKW